MFIIPSIDLSMKLSLSEVFVSNIIVTMVISNKSCCKHVLFTNLSDFISTTTRVTSVDKYIVVALMRKSSVVMMKKQ